MDWDVTVEAKPENLVIGLNGPQKNEQEVRAHFAATAGLSDLKIIGVALQKKISPVIAVPPAPAGK